MGRHPEFELLKWGLWPLRDSQPVCLRNSGPTSLRSSNPAVAAPSQGSPMILSAELRGSVTVRMPGIAPKLLERFGALRGLGPMLGQHTDEALMALGFQEVDNARLCRVGAVQ